MLLAFMKALSGGPQQWALYTSLPTPQRQRSAGAYCLYTAPPLVAATGPFQAQHARPQAPRPPAAARAAFPRSALPSTLTYPVSSVPAAADAINHRAGAATTCEWQEGLPPRTTRHPLWLGLGQGSRLPS